MPVFITSTTWNCSGIALLLKLRRKLVIFDVHEDIPATMFKKAWLRGDIVRRFVAKGVVLARDVLEYGLRRNRGRHARHRLAIRPAKTEVVHNYPTVSLIDGTPRADVGKPDGTTVFAFAGDTPAA